MKKYFIIFSFLSFPLHYQTMDFDNPFLSFPLFILAIQTREACILAFPLKTLPFPSLPFVCFTQSNPNIVLGCMSDMDMSDMDVFNYFYVFPYLEGDKSIFMFVRYVSHTNTSENMKSWEQHSSGFSNLSTWTLKFMFLFLSKKFICSDFLIY